MNSELLGHCHKPNAVLVEHLHQTGEVEQLAGVAIYLVGHHRVDAAGFDVGQQPPERLALHVAPGEPAIIVTVGSPTQPSWR